MTGFSMNLFKVTWSYIRRRGLNTLLNVLLLALGIATIVVLLLVGKQVEHNLTRNAQGIDLVVGAKGSPLQLILASIFHLDAPTGNIPLTDAAQIVQNPAVKQAIPLALGDSYQGYRIVGSTPDYLAHYGMTTREGRLWEGEMETVVGDAVARQAGLRVGDTFTSSHGLTEGGQAHESRPMQVVGILEPSGSVMDRLILTSIETVWAVHEPHEATEPDAETHASADSTAVSPPPAVVPPLPASPDSTAATSPPRPLFPMMAGAASAPLPALYTRPDAATKEITALLVQYSSPLAVAMFPRFVNGQTNLQAASPATETTRLFELLGGGFKALQAFGLILMLAAALGVFIALYNALRERQYDLALMRTMGASRLKLLWHVLLEGLLLVLMGTALGLLLGHAATEILGWFLRQAQQVEITGLAWAVEELWLVALALALGVVAALLPAFQAYRIDIARTLAAG